MPGPASDPSFQFIADGTYLKVSKPFNKRGFGYSLQSADGRVLASGQLVRGSIVGTGELSPAAAEIVHAAAKGTPHAVPE